MNDSDDDNDSRFVEKTNDIILPNNSINKVVPKENEMTLFDNGANMDIHLVEKSELSNVNESKENEHANEKDLVFFIEKLPYLIRTIENFILYLIPEWTGVFIQFFIGRYYFEADEAKNGKIKDSKFISHESERLQSIIQSMRMHNPDRLQRALQLRGILNPANLFDFVMFRWLNYLDEDSTACAIDVKENIIQVTQNVGLLAALLFTVAFERVTALADNEFELKSVWHYIYIISWVLSSIGFFNSTAVSVIYGIVVPELADNDECIRFLKVVDEITLGFASSAHLYNLMVGIVFFFLGTFSMPFVYLSVEQGAIVFFSATPMLTAIVIFLLQTVVALRYSRTLSQITYHWKAKSIGNKSPNNPLCSCDGSNKFDWIDKKYYIRHEDMKVFLQAYIRSTLHDITKTKNDNLQIERLSHDSLKQKEDYTTDDSFVQKDELPHDSLKRIDDITGDDFLDFIKGCRLYDDGNIKIGNQLLTDIKIDKIVKFEGQRITALSEHNARLFYTGYIKANSFKFVDVNNYASDPEKYMSD